MGNVIYHWAMYIYHWVIYMACTHALERGSEVPHAHMHEYDPVHMPMHRYIARINEEYDPVLKYFRPAASQIINNLVQVDMHTCE